MLQATETLRERQADLRAAVMQEDYRAAAQLRDAVLGLELRQRDLQLAWDSHLRSTIMHRLGACARARRLLRSCMQSSDQLLCSLILSAWPRQLTLLAAAGEIVVHRKYE